jgi:S-adenosylmethionine:tRNA ribosyltransferase-isomerase
MHPKDLQIESYHYHLPEKSIAVYPLENRDESKLLFFKNGKVNHLSFKELSAALPNNSLLILNDTKVFHARLFFKKETGGMIEIFCLNPHFPSSHAEIFESNTECVWQCYVGNAKKWKQGKLKISFEFEGSQHICLAELVEKLDDTYLVKFTWDAPHLNFLNLTEILGKLPIPPYLNRESEVSDENRYQTVFADKIGSVAAPTASLHFTPSVFDDLVKKQIETCKLTLHVGAGTFKPVTAKTIDGHQMHHESIELSFETLRFIK